MHHLSFYAGLALLSSMLPQGSSMLLQGEDFLLFPKVE
jgi:hypothetical protein